ncbi:Lysine-specific histone demethylase 1A [Escovopsis weberi]|uniref:Lysine-specific histone demethylase 1A n=1 Tax=Escovopsis weberi TaxID=150374 RepID=A0A0M8MVE0_ESCWE|nr:Lysine-specific histone demethylase 1A [Escovopsis weberi]
MKTTVGNHPDSGHGTAASTDCTRAEDGPDSSSLSEGTLSSLSPAAKSSRGLSPPATVSTTTTASSAAPVSADPPRDIEEARQDPPQEQLPDMAPEIVVWSEGMEGVDVSGGLHQPDPHETLAVHHHLTMSDEAPRQADDVSVTTYLNIRNSILRLWLRQPWIGVTRHEAVGCANARWFDAASVCYDWLVRRGYINFGCVELPEPQVESRVLPQMLQKEKRKKRRRTVAVIGAGISGLSCARQLEGLFKQYTNHFQERGEELPSVVVLEGRSRVGGRVYSREFKAKANPADRLAGFDGKRHTAEMGGMIITGFDRGNPMNVVVRGQLSLPCHPLTAETTIYDSNGKPVDPVRDLLVEKLYNDCLDRVSEFKYKTQPPKLIEGNRDLLDEGRDSLADGPRTIVQAEEAAAALAPSSVLQQSVPATLNRVPVSADKLTGRVHTEPGIPATLKASEKAKLMGWNVKTGASERGSLDLSDAAATEGATLGSLLDHAITQYRHVVDLNAQDHRLLNWHIANLEYSNATNLHNLSLSLWDIDAGNEWEGSHAMVVGGYQSVARGLLQCPYPLNLTTKFPVKKIRYHGDSFDEAASVECEDGTLVEADAVVCTIPLGVLKQGSIQFEPPLPPWKTDAIERLGFGILNKVVLVYEKVFWDSDRHIFGVLRDAANRHSTSQQDYKMNRGRFFQWFNVTNTTGLPCLIALMAGDAGFDIEHTSNDSLVAEATDILRGVFGNDVPYPVETIVTRWGSDRFARGSYSSAGPEMEPEDYNIMARTVGNLFFAGEHTIGTHPATVHGAYLSGLRAASEVLEAMIGPIEVPTPLILPRDSLLLHKRKEAAKDPRQARLEAYEVEVWEYVQSVIGERPARPAKVAGNAYLLFSKAQYDSARKVCEGNRKPGKSRSLPNEVRILTSRMWKEASAEERRPYEEQAAEQKTAYTQALQDYNEAAGSWDRQAISLRAAYERDHPSVPGPREGAGATPRAQFQKHRRGAKSVSYHEDGDTDVDM